MVSRWLPYIALFVFVLGSNTATWMIASGAPDNLIHDAPDELGQALKDADQVLDTLSLEETIRIRNLGHNLYRQAIIGYLTFNDKNEPISFTASFDGIDEIEMTTLTESYVDADKDGPEIRVWFSEEYYEGL